MKLAEAMAVFDPIRWNRVAAVNDSSGDVYCWVDGTELVGADMKSTVECCGVPVVKNSQQGVERIGCGRCRRTIRKLAGQWIVEEWGDRGIQVAHPDLIRAGVAAWYLCQSLLAVRDGATDFLITEVADELQKALGDALPKTKRPKGATLEEETDVELLAGIDHLPREFAMVAEKANAAGIRGYKLVNADYGVDRLSIAERAGAAEPEGDLMMAHFRARIRLTFRKVGT